jgi:hypothetical protein
MEDLMVELIPMCLNLMVAMNGVVLVIGGMTILVDIAITMIMGS